MEINEVNSIKGRKYTALGTRDLVERPIQDASGSSDNGILPLAIGGGEIVTYLIEPMD